MFVLKNLLFGQTALRQRLLKFDVSLGGGRQQRIEPRLFSTCTTRSQQEDGNDDSPKGYPRKPKKGQFSDWIKKTVEKADKDVRKYAFDDVLRGMEEEAEEAELQADAERDIVSGQGGNEHHVFPHQDQEGAIQHAEAEPDASVGNFQETPVPDGKRRGPPLPPAVPDVVVSDMERIAKGKSVAMPIIGQRVLPSLDTTQLPFDDREAAEWRVVYGRGVPTGVSQQLCLADNLSLLSKRSRLAETFRTAPSIFHLLNIVSRLRGRNAIEANYISFLHVLFTQTNRGRHKHLVSMLYATVGSAKNPRETFVKSNFSRLVVMLARDRLHELSDTGAAVCLGTLHLLGAQRLFTSQDLTLHLHRIKRMSLSSTLVLADAVSRVRPWQQSEHHDVLVKEIIQSVGDKMFLYAAATPESLAGGEYARPSAAAFDNEHAVAYLAVMARCMRLPSKSWQVVASHVAKHAWSFTEEEIGLLLDSMLDLSLQPSRYLLNALSLRVEEDVKAFHFPTRVICVLYLLNSGRRLNASVSCLLKEAHSVTDQYIMRHPYNAVRLHDVLMLLRYIDPVRFSGLRNERLAYLRDHLWRIKDIMHSNYYPSIAALNNVDEPAVVGRPAFESLLLPLLTASQRSSPPAETSSMLYGQEAKAAEDRVREISQSVEYNCWVNGVRVAAALLCTEDGEFVPWDSVSDALGPRPGWWREGAQISHVRDGVIHMEEDVLELTDGAGGDAGIQEELRILESGPAASPRLGGGKQRATVLPGPKELSEKSAAGEDPANAGQPMDEEQAEVGGGDASTQKAGSKPPKANRQRKRYIALDKHHMEAGDLKLRPIAVCIYVDKMALLQPRKFRQFNGYVTTQANILYQSGWAAISIPFSEVSPDLPTEKRQAALYHNLSKVMKLPVRDDLVQVHSASRKAGGEREPRNSDSRTDH